MEEGKSFWSSLEQFGAVWSSLELVWSRKGQFGAGKVSLESGWSRECQFGGRLDQFGGRLDQFGAVWSQFGGPEACANAPPPLVYDTLPLSKLIWSLV